MDYQSIPSPFYRVSIKALVFDDQNRLLVCLVPGDKWEMPGGGLEHGESIEDCLKREFQEELGSKVESVDNVAFTYKAKSPRGYWAMRLAIPVKLESRSFKNGEMSDSMFITKDELLSLDMQPDEGAIKKCVDQIWPTA